MLEEFEESPDGTLFEKESRVLTYNGDSSVRLTERELNAYRVRVVLAPFYSSWKPNSNLTYTPPREFFGRLTHWNGSNGVIKDSFLQWQRQVVFDWRNEGMLTRYWNAILAELYFPVVKTNVLALAETLGEAFVNPAIAPLFNVNYNERTVELWAAQLATGVVATRAGFPQPFLPQWGFPPPESLWKLQSDREFLWCQWEVDSWHLPEFPGLSIDPPGAAQNDENSNGDSEVPENRPTPGEPPAPEDESPADPRNLPEDYSTAEPEEPEEPDEPVNVVVTVQPGWGWQLAGQPDIVSTEVFTTTCGEYVSVPAPVMELLDQGFQKVWQLKGKSPAGADVVRNVAPQWPGGEWTQKGAPVAVSTPC